MRLWIKAGVLGDLQIPAQKGLNRLAGRYFLEGLDFFVTSIREGNHAPGSLHYVGLAFDYLPQGRPIEKDREALGPNWDVVESNNGARHAEYDPEV